MNGSTVRTLDLKRIKPGSVAITNHGAAVPVVHIGPSHYRPISVESLRRHLGKRGRLTTVTGRIFAGKLTRMGERAATVKETPAGGTDTELVLLSKITKAEVPIPDKQAKPAH